ncbi:hypothetical protein JdFRA1000001_32c [uncultured archaeal virus]|uniref:Uncharacterized protein n=1 Tax=uncultured archaeal virus TaxID=1960247 RepID=A0A1S5Y2W9_9VIRU|nr:hypothetical protein JdFRA1000001_32c [uncultured archaeal virus]
MTLESLWTYEDIEAQLDHSDRYTIYLFYMLLNLRARYNDGRMSISYQQLSGYYSKQRFKITPKGIDIPKWTSIARSLRRLAYEIYPPVFYSDKRSGVFTPTDAFWIYIQERKRKNEGYFWRLKRENRN